MEISDSFSQGTYREFIVSCSDVERAVRKIIKRRERGFANTERFATSLSEWESYGDWRL